MGTKIERATSLPDNVVIYGGEAACLDASARFVANDFLIIDGIEWPGMADVQTGLIKQKRIFKEQFHPPGIPPQAALGKRAIVDAVDALVGRMFAEPREDARSSFRPMISGPEPMHFDVYPAPLPVLTAFINIARTPRIYRIGPTLEHLVTTKPDEMRAVMRKCSILDLSYAIRVLTVKGLPPMPAGSDAHHVELAPGSVWLFNGKTVSHEVVYGEGAIGVSWVLPESKAPSQELIMKELQ